MTIAVPPLQPASGASEDAQPTRDVDSLLHVPAVDYRREWVLLGSFSVLADDPSKGAKQLHAVYAAPKTVGAYRGTGAFPDGAVLVKDVYATKTESLTTGTASYADALVGRFVMVKDADDEYAGASPLWGDGWGWAFYEGTETTQTVTTDYRKDCLGCHEPVRSQDLIYVQGYPVLKR
ncbi:MAG: cytochrome P460 family protein [Gammaproteobacteria bacterium]|nr:cytochrome P460 family protein [Gammaproteobacteria bacterium]NIR82786.1 cytochrome P460 family protein [Gammaproteobacteria bacterium]NIR89651.1 cytochrome P460 family protein [Gammaproteobacteria bacterium]NIU03946.1 cytochrome P460 family protein [Gammaproteobacteria bacterium]NIV51262.1 cytochrome c, class I [Gammaproteobacteria bacterium]